MKKGRNIPLPVPELRLNYLAGAGGSSNYRIGSCPAFLPKEPQHRGRQFRRTVSHIMSCSTLPLEGNCGQFGLRLDFRSLGSPGTSSHVSTVIKSSASYPPARPQCGQGISALIRAEASLADNGPSSGFSIRFTTIF